MNKPDSVVGGDAGRAVPGAVFVSFASADRKEALKVCSAIERRGVPCWISARDVGPGENYQEAIVRAIRASRAMVLVFSHAANNSNEIKKELSLASKHQVPVLALRVEDVEPSDAFAYELSTRQWIDAFEGWDKSLDALVQTLGRAGSGERVAAVPLSPPPASGRRASVSGGRSPLLWAGGALALLVLVAAGWFLLRPASAAAHSMQVRLTGFTRLSSELPGTLPAALNDELGAAFNDDGVIGVSTAAAPAPGNAPAYALGGTVAHDGDRVKVIVRLVNERTGAALWSNNYDYSASGLDHVARWASVDVSQAIRCGLFGASTYPKALPDAVLADYLRYCDHSSPTKDIDTVQRIVAAVPDFSWGWSALALAKGGAAQQVPNGPHRDALLKEATAAADRAIALDPSNSEAFVLKSLLIDPNDLLRREALLKQAIAARALACGCEHHEYGNFLMEVGRVEDAIREFERSTDVLPLGSGTQHSLAEAMLVIGNPNGAAERYKAAHDLRDDPIFDERNAVTKAAITGVNDGADKAIQNPKFGAPSQNVRAIADGFAALNSKDSAVRARAAAQLAGLPPAWITLPEVPLLAALGDSGDAMKFMAGNVQNGFAAARTWLWYPSMENVRRDPRFAGFAGQLGLVKYWRTTRTRPDLCAARNAPPFCATI